MEELKLAVAAGGSTTLAEVQDLVADVWRQVRQPGSNAYKAAGELLSVPPEQLPADLQSALELRPQEQHLDPTGVAVLVAIWLVDKVLDKSFDLFWDHVFQPRIDAILGKGTVVVEKDDTK